MNCVSKIVNKILNSLVPSCQQGRYKPQGGANGASNIGRLRKESPYSEWVQPG